MTGDGAISPTAGFSHDAGIIPRVLCHLYNSIEMEGVDCAIKCSFIELYNEDLRDLLSDDDNRKVMIVDPSSSSNQYSSRKASGITKGQENIFIQSAHHGLKILQAGLKKRQVASTKINDLSSRSHTIFSITVYMSMRKRAQEQPYPELTESQLAAIVNESCIVGKINLVDLAGSENIGKSGAENKRAREAGMINQSLLTLGRVINSLVDKSSHIPYRESKLTRLLQDSLGGQTRTCIIANVSPAHINLEETLSTLEYASKAKSIRNKPQLGSLVSKTTLLKEWSDDYIKLRRDWEATRKKTGVYLTEDHYKELMAENAERKLRIEEQERKVVALDSQIRMTRDDLETTKSQLHDIRRQLSSTTKNLSETITNLATKEEELESAKSNLFTETQLKEAHATTEHELQNIATELITKLDKSMEDINTLQGRLAQASSRDKVNQTNLVNHHKIIGASYDKLSDAMCTFDSTNKKEIQDFQQSIKKAMEVHTSQLEALTCHIEESSASSEELLKVFTDTGKESSTQFEQAQKELSGIQESTKMQIRVGLGGLKESVQNLAQETLKQVNAYKQSTANHSTVLRENLVALFNDVDSFVTGQATEIKELNEKLVTSSKASINESERSVVQGLSGLLAEEKEKSEREREALLQRVRAMIQEQEQGQAKRMETRIKAITSTLAKHNRTLSAGSDTYSKSIIEALEKQAALKARLDVHRSDLDKKIGDGARLAEQHGKELQTTADGIEKDIHEVLNQQTEEICSKLSAFEDHNQKTEELRESQFNTMVVQYQKSHNASKSLSKHLLGGLQPVVEELKSGNDLVTSFIGNVEKAWECAMNSAQTVVDGSLQEIENMKYLCEDSEVPSTKELYSIPRELPMTMSDGTKGIRLSAVHPSTSEAATLSPQFEPLATTQAEQENQDDSMNTDADTDEEDIHVEPSSTTPALEDEPMVEEAQEKPRQQPVRSPLSELNGRYNSSVQSEKKSDNEKKVPIVTVPAVPISPQKVNYFPASKRQTRSIPSVTSATGSSIPSVIQRKRPAASQLESGRRFRLNQQSNE